VSVYVYICMYMCIRKLEGGLGAEGLFYRYLGPKMTQMGA
jgi:hypothetical protein